MTSLAGAAPDRDEAALLRGLGAAPVPVRLPIRSLGPAERLRRAALGPLGGLGVAIAVLPVPIIHLVLPPVALLTGVVLGVRRGLVRALFGAARGTCPCCGQEQSLGLTGTPYRLPRELKCHACRQILTLEAA
ncbi:MAG: hypothetical protein IPI92_05670 [Gemmatimonadetes bacterium]|nr:hypothetical protein [Gemmatimonadota bacterium]MBK7783963.1 hypothetical protein [Gemmatimonadota bacterium]